MLKNAIKLAGSIAQAGKTKNSLDFVKAGIDTVNLIDKAAKKKKKDEENRKKQTKRP